MKKLLIIALVLFITQITFAQQYVWQQKTSIPSLGRHVPVGFSINGLAYFGMGQGLNYSGYNDLWE